MFVIEYCFNLGDIGCWDGFAVGTVDESEHGYISVHVKKAVVHMPRKDWDITDLINGSTRTSLEEAIERKWDAAKSHVDLRSSDVG